jgi:hypothetical protein
MAEYRLLLDAFAEARRSWDDLIALQPDVVAGSGHLEDGSLAEFERRVAVHREAIDYLADAFEMPRADRGEPASPPDISREPFDERLDRRQEGPPAL